SRWTTSATPYVPSAASASADGASNATARTGPSVRATVRSSRSGPRSAPVTSSSRTTEMGRVMGGLLSDQAAADEELDEGLAARAGIDVDLDGGALGARLGRQDAGARSRL